MERLEVVFPDTGRIEEERAGARKRRRAHIEPERSRGVNTEQLTQDLRRKGLLHPESDVQRVWCQRDPFYALWRFPHSLIELEDERTGQVVREPFLNKLIADSIEFFEDAYHPAISTDGFVQRGMNILRDPECDSRIKLFALCMFMAVEPRLQATISGLYQDDDRHSFRRRADFDRMGELLPTLLHQTLHAPVGINNIIDVVNGFLQAATRSYLDYCG